MCGPVMGSSVRVIIGHRLAPRLGHAPEDAASTVRSSRRVFYLYCLLTKLDETNGIGNKDHRSALCERNEQRVVRLRLAWFLLIHLTRVQT